MLMQVINIPAIQFKDGTLCLATHPTVSYDNSYLFHRESRWGLMDNDHRIIKISKDH